MKHKYFGHLTMPEGNLQEITYVLVNNELNRSFNLSKYLKENQDKNIGLVINIHNKQINKDIFCEVGKVEVINEIYEINGHDISSVIWDLADKSYTDNINIIIDDGEDNT
jgi:hypothetical protein